MVRVAKTSLFLYKSNVTPLALALKINASHKTSTIKTYCENCIITAIFGCKFFFMILLESVMCVILFALYYFVIRSFGSFVKFRTRSNASVSTVGSTNQIKVIFVFKPYDMADQSYLKCGLAATWSFMSVVAMRIVICCVCVLRPSLKCWVNKKYFLISSMYFCIKL